MNLPVLEAQLPKSNPRVAVMSMRNIERHVSRACGYEFEDMICDELDFAHLVAPEPATGPRAPLMRQMRNRLTQNFGPRPVFDVLNTGVGKAQMEADVDLFFFSAALPRDLIELSNVRDWRKRSRFAVCWMQELWAAGIPLQKKTLDILNQFDHVICSFHHTIEPLRERLSVPVTYLPWGIDTELFCPYPNPPQRTIEVAGIGAIPDATEKALVRHADEVGTTFLYQTVFGPSAIQSHKAHRHNFAGQLKRSEFFLCYLAKFANAQRNQQVEFGLRYIEGVAAGAVVLGDPVDNPAFQEHLGWTDSLIRLDSSETRPQDLIRALKAQPERLAAARRRNVANALLRHDNVYRWQEVLKIAGLPTTPAMRQRQNRLQALADAVLSEEEDGGDFSAQHGVSAVSSSRGSELSVG